MNTQSTVVQPNIELSESKMKNVLSVFTNIPKS